MLLRAAIAHGLMLALAAATVLQAEAQVAAQASAASRPARGRAVAPRTPPPRAKRRSPGTMPPVRC